jgi:hypothetical protein
LESEPAVIALVLQGLFGCSPSRQNFRECVFRFPEKQAIFPLEIHGSPALAIFPELDISDNLGL